MPTTAAAAAVTAATWRQPKRYPGRSSWKAATPSPMASAIPTPAGTRSTWGAIANGPRPPRPASQATAHATTAMDQARPAQARRGAGADEQRQRGGGQEGPPERGVPDGSDRQPQQLAPSRARGRRHGHTGQRLPSGRAAQARRTTTAPGAPRRPRWLPLPWPPPARRAATRPSPGDTTLPSARPSATTRSRRRPTGASDVTKASSRPSARLEPDERVAPRLEPTARDGAADAPEGSPPCSSEPAVDPGSTEARRPDAIDIVGTAVVCIAVGRLSVRDRRETPGPGDGRSTGTPRT